MMILPQQVTEGQVIVLKANQGRYADFLGREF